MLILEITVIIATIIYSATNIREIELELSAHATSHHDSQDLISTDKLIFMIQILTPNPYAILLTVNEVQVHSCFNLFQELISTQLKLKAI